MCPGSRNCIVGNKPYYTSIVKVGNCVWFRMDSCTVMTCVCIMPWKMRDRGVCHHPRAGGSSGQTWVTCCFCHTTWVLTDVTLRATSLHVWAPVMSTLSSLCHCIILPDALLHHLIKPAGPRPPEGFIFEFDDLNWFEPNWIESNWNEKLWEPLVFIIVQ